MPFARQSLTAAAAMLAFAVTSSAQVGPGYNFSQSLGTYTPITGGTVIATATGTSGSASMDDVSYALTLPFAFNFAGLPQTTAYVTTNGYLTFGSTIPSGYTALSSTSTYAGAVAAMSRDLQGCFNFTGTTTLGSDQLTGVSSLGTMQVGSILSGTGIPTGTTVLAILGNTITMSATATAAGTPTVTAYGAATSEMRYQTLGTAPNRVFVVQWTGFKNYSTNVDMSLNFQIQLTEAPGGVINVVYGNCTPGTNTSTTTYQVGLRGSTNAFPANVNNRMNTKGVNDDWLLSVAGTSNTSGMLFNSVAPANTITSGLTYTWGLAGTPATSVSYGRGCYSRSATWYELFGSFDLANTAIHLIPNGNGGYTMLPGTPTAFVHTVAGLALTDDSLGTLTLPTAFNYPGGSTTALTVCSNGFIWALPNTSYDFSPSSAELFTNGARYCPLWCDMNPDGTTNLNNVFAEVDSVNNKAYVTWSNVPTYTTPGSVNMQVEFNLTTGEVNYTYGATTLPAITSLVGWSPGTGFSTADIGNFDISAMLPATFSTTATESLPLALAASNTPALGATVTYTASRVPAMGVSAVLISLIQVNPGIDLGYMGAPDCLALVDLNSAASSLMLGSPTATFAFAVPNNPAFVGLPLNVQAASLDAAANALGVITSNGISSVVGNF